MKKTFALICSLSIAFTLFAQAVTSPVGDYSLEGEMETAAGFRLDSGGHFQFFFSYGALDRQAKGTWRLDGERILFTSEPKDAKDFQLIESKKNTDKYVTILLNGVPREMSQYFSASATVNGKEIMEKADERGQILLPIARTESFVLRFEWSPEKFFRYNVGSSLHNQFSFRLLPSIMDVMFDNAVFTVTSEELTGTLPFTGDHIFHFRRVTGNNETP